MSLALEPDGEPRRAFDSAEMGAMAHLYRGEVYRSTIWRTRLDNTTNWSIVTYLPGEDIAESARVTALLALLAYFWGRLALVSAIIADRTVSRKSSRPMMVTSVVSWKKPMKMLTRGGMTIFSACGSTIRRNDWIGVRPSTCAASRWPLAARCFSRSS